METDKRVEFENFTWIDILEPDIEQLYGIAKDYQLDVFQIKDSLERGHLPKFEKTTHHNFLILRGFTANISNRITTIIELSNKIAFFYSDSVLITVHRAEFGFLNIANKDFKNSEHLVLYLIKKILQTFEQPSTYLSDFADETERTIFLKDFSKVSLEDLYFHKSQARITKKLLQISQNTLNEIQVKPENQYALQDIKDKILNLILTRIMR